jgi:hypothetical protein
MLGERCSRWNKIVPSWQSGKSQFKRSREIDFALRLERHPHVNYP